MCTFVGYIAREVQVTYQGRHYGPCESVAPNSINEWMDPTLNVRVMTIQSFKARTYSRPANANTANVCCRLAVLVDTIDTIVAAAAARIPRIYLAITDRCSGS